MGEDSRLRGRGLYPSARYWIDIFRIILLQKLYCSIEKTENKWKQLSHIKTILCKCQTCLKPY